MDNITHSLIGGLIGRAAIDTLQRRNPRPDPAFTRAVYWTAVLASNSPDVDFLPSLVMRSGPLAYLLDHRGFTHTLLFAPILAFIATILGGLLGGNRAEALRDRGKLRVLGVVALFGMLMHLVADSWNEYGIHVFSPFYQRWNYGDFIFIVEPLIWFTILPWAFFESRLKVLRVVCALFWAAMFGLLLSGRFMDFGVGAGIAGCGVLLGILQWRARSWKTAASFVLVALCAFKGVSFVAKSRATESIRVISPDERIGQIAASPAPGNPFCWRVLTAGVAPDGNGGESYIARIGGVSLLPGLFEPLDCPIRLRGPRSAPLEPIKPEPLAAGDRSVEWVGEFRRPIGELRRLARESCEFASLLEFARIPFWVEENGSLLAGDLRYDRGPQRGSFAVFRFTGAGNDSATGKDDRHCLARRGWEPPIWELLGDRYSASHR